MIIILTLIVLCLVGFSIISSEDLTNKTKLTVPSWLVMGIFFALFICSLFICKQTISRDAILDYQEGKYKIETRVYSDTTYVLKKNK